MSGCTVEVVYGQVTPELAEEAIGFWVSEQVFPSRDMAQQRARELLAVARDGSGQIIGVSTTMVVNVRWLLDNRFFIYRTFVGQEHRQQGVARQLLDASMNHLIKLHGDGQAGDAIGVYSEYNLPAIAQARNKAVEMAGDMPMRYMGRSDQGAWRRVGYFDGVRISKTHLS